MYEKELKRARKMINNYIYVSQKGVILCVFRCFLVLSQAKTSKS